MTHPVNIEAMRHVAYYFWPRSPGAYRPGSFIENLLRAFASADTINFRRLSAAFPEYGWPMQVAMTDEQGKDDILSALRDYDSKDK